MATFVGGGFKRHGQRQHVVCSVRVFDFVRLAALDPLLNLKLQTVGRIIGAPTVTL